MELFSKLNPASKDWLSMFINQRWRQLYELEKEWGERGIRFLLLTNSGGAIATLSFLGASPQAINLFWAKIALFLFVLGVFLVGVSTAKLYHHMSWLFTEWKKGVNELYSDKITWEHLQEEDTKRAVGGFWDYALLYLSFGCFGVGCISGAISLFS